MEVDVLADNPRELSEERLKIRNDAIKLIRSLCAQKVADVVELPKPTSENVTLQSHQIDVA